ncbi:hypothetical protein TKK_0000859 [Trichogramma kaykai]
MSKSDDSIKLQRLRENVDWRIKEERCEFLRRLFPMIGHWQGQLPDLRDVFRKEEIDRLLADAINYTRRGRQDDRKEDHEVVDPAATCSSFFNCHDYCSDESGLTHFRVACMSYSDDVIEKFLELGCHRRESNTNRCCSVDPPLHWALRNNHEELAELLLRYGSDPNLPNAEGSTPLHLICQRDLDDDEDALAELFFEIIDNEHQPVQVDARDNSGNTALHLALGCGLKIKAEFLLRRGATILRDNEGRTPLQLAVANILPAVVDLLLERGVDLSTFVFPTESYFGRAHRDPEDDSWLVKLQLASSALAVLESLEKRGYEVSRGDVFVVVKFFAEHDLFERTRASVEKCGNWYEQDDEFTSKAKEVTIVPSLSLYQLLL